MWIRKKGQILLHCQSCVGCETSSVAFGLTFTSLDAALTQPVLLEYAPISPAQVRQVCTHADSYQVSCRYVVSLMAAFLHHEVSRLCFSMHLCVETQLALELLHEFDVFLLRLLWLRSLLHFCLPCVVLGLALNEERHVSVFVRCARQDLCVQSCRTCQVRWPWRSLRQCQSCRESTAKLTVSWMVSGRQPA